MRIGRVFFIVILMMLVFTPDVGTALQVSDACPQLVESALFQLGTNCANMEHNSVCYGFEHVDAIFTDDVPDEFFTQPADRAGLTTLDTIETAPFDAAQNVWGIAMMSVLANLPNTLPGQALVIMLLGDVTVENAVASDEALVHLEEPVIVRTAYVAALHSAPPTLYSDTELVGAVLSSTALEADGISPDGRWLRVLFPVSREAAAWVSWEVLDSAADFSALPVIDDDSRTPMQVFYFSTGLGRPECAEVPPSQLFVQGPDEIEVDISANGIDIRVGSTAILQTVSDPSSPSGLALQVIVPSGLVRINPDTPNERMVGPAFTVRASLDFDADGNLIAAAADFSEPRPLSQEELEALEGLEGISGNLLHYPSYVPVLIRPSGVGQPIPLYGFDDPNQALSETMELCSQGVLPDEICDTLNQ